MKRRGPGLRSSPEKGDHCPDGEEHADQGEKDHASRSVGGVFDSFGCIAGAMFPPGQAVSDDQSEPQCQHELGQEILKVEDVHFDATVTADIVAT